MKIAVIVSTFPPYRGGMGNVAREEARALKDRGHAVTVFTPEYKKSQTRGDASVEVKKLKPFLALGNAAFLPQLVFKLRGFDAVYLHHPFIGGGEFAALWKLFFGRDKIFFVTYHMDLVGRGLRNLIFWLYIKSCAFFVLRMADAVRVTSFDYLKSGQIKNFFTRRKNKFVEIPLGVDVNRFYPGQKNDKLLNRYGIKTDDKAALFVGGLDKAHYFKGVEILLRAFKKIFEQPGNVLAAKLLIVGDGGERIKYEKLAGELGLAQQTIFAGAVSDKELPAHYRLADVVVLPSLDRSEAFGLTILEALSSGKPVVVSDLPGVRTLVDDKNGRLVKPGDIDDLAKQIGLSFSAPLTVLPEGRYSLQNMNNKLINWIENRG